MVSHRIKHSFRQSQLDWGSHIRTRHKVPHTFEPIRLSKSKLAAKGERKAIDNQLHGMDKQASTKLPLQLLGNSASAAHRHVPIVLYDESIERNSTTRFIDSVQPSHVDDIQPATVDDSNLSRHENRRRKNQRKLQDMYAIETDLLPEEHSNRTQRDNIASKKNSETPKPLYLVVSNEEQVTESVEDFKEPVVVIRSVDAERPRSRKASTTVSGVSSEYGPGGRKRSPLLGALRGGPGNCRVYNTRVDVPELVDFAAGVECMDLATTPSVVVCPYPNTDDRHLSQPLRTHGVWEPHIVRLFQAALLTNKEFGVYDIGANIGQYALLAAAMGRRVVAVELHKPNIYRLHKAIKLGRFEDKVRR